MVRIRYSELPAGLHVSAKRHGRRTTIYLLPGLTIAERKAALTRVRSSGRLGHGPPLPAAGMAVAIGVDRARTTVRNGAFAMRSHPVLLLPPLILLVSSAIVFVLMSFVTVTIPQLRPQAAGPSPNSYVEGGKPAVSQGGAGSPAHHHGALPGHLAPSTGTADRPSGAHHGASPGPSGTPHRSTGPTSSPSPSPKPSSAPSPSPSPSSSCVNLGALGLCLSL